MNARPPQRALERVQSALGAPASVVRQFDTMSNSAWLIDCAGERAVLRLHSVSFGAPVTDHAREIRIHRLAADAALSPPILLADIEHGLLLTRYESDGAYSRSEIEDPVVLAAIASTLRALHDLPLDEALGGYTLSEAADCYYARAGSPDDAALTALVRQVKDNEAQAEDTLVLCHRDLLHSNILRTDPIHLIDWEFASPGERWFDLAALICWHELDGAAEALLLDAYWQRALDDEQQAALTRAKQSFRALCQLWSLPPA